ncbi:MFS transporter [Rhodobacter ferrooxidans]|uniref:Major facilitator superfamily MFS_1 n=1 Tax=Rhodobacter ferrooxidans TaxID=371731 RepID=C8RZI6_9RHOB|nr:MFS transporter [Rhodobacter sp. SW2]EEW25783.1 major facilitator superfamily MFS_1 [Rhodobacter sp. SW2]
MGDAPKSGFWLVLALWGAGLGAAAQFGKVVVIYDLMARQYPAAAATSLGLLVSMVGFVGLVFGTTAGLLVQRAGYRRVLVAALGFGAVLSLVQAPMLPLPLMLALRLAEGASHLAIVVAAPVLIAQIAPLARQGLAMTLWSSFFGVTFALMAWAGRPLAEAFGPGALFAAHAAYMALFAALLWLMLPRDVPQEAKPLSLKEIIRQHGVIYASPRLAAPALGFFCYTITYVALLTLLPVFAGAPHQVLLAAAMPLVSIAVSLTLGVWLLRRMTAVSAVMLGYAVALAAAAALWLGWQNPPLMLTASLTLAAALGLVQGASFASIPQLNASGADRARAAGAVAQLGNLGTTSGTPMLSALILAHGISGLAGFVLLFSALGIALHLINAARRA